MKAFKKRMIEDMQLAGLNERTQVSYSSAVRKLVDFCKKPPNKITEKDIRCSPNKETLILVHDSSKSFTSSDSMNAIRRRVEVAMLKAKRFSLPDSSCSNL